jgi:hypothetical protein
MRKGSGVIMRRLSRNWMVATCALGLLAGCASSSESKEDEAADKKKVNQTQIQESLQRFVGVFLDRILQAAEPLMADTAPPRVRTAAMRQILLYSTSSIDIASGRFPEANLLDMLVFMDLTSGVLKEYWIPEVFGEDGRPLETAFARSAEDLERVAAGVLTPAQLAQVHKLVEDWRRENPGQRRVEQIRPFATAVVAGRLATEREREANGILSSVRSATKSADEAVLLAERAMFLTQRMPFLLRFHARLGVQELIKEGLLAVEGSDTLARAKELRPLISDATTLATNLDQAAKESRELLETLRPLLQARTEGEELRVEKLVGSANHLVDESRAELRELGGVERTLSSAERLTEHASRLFEDVRAEGLRGLLWVGAVALFLVSLFWGGYVVAHWLTRDRGRDRGGSRTAPPPKAAAA